MAPQFTRQSILGHMILIAILLTCLTAFAVGLKQETDTEKSIFQGGAVSYSHVVHDYGPAYKYPVKSSRSSATVNRQYAGAAASHGYAASSTPSPAALQSTTGYASSHGYASQTPSFVPFTHTYAKLAKSPDVAYIQTPSVLTHHLNRLNSLPTTSSPQQQYITSVPTSPKYHFDNNVQTVAKQVPYPVFQPYSLSAPYSVAVPVSVHTPYAVAVPKIYPITVDKPLADTKHVPYQVKMPVNIPVAQPVPIIVPYPFYVTTKAIIRNDVQGHGDYSPSKLRVY